MALFAFSVAPLGAGESVTEPVARAIKVVRDSGLPHRTDAMFTSIVDLGHGSFIRPAGI